MILTNVSFGIMAFLPQGWIFMAFIIIIESLILARLLTGEWKNKSIALVVLMSNFLSGIAGIVASMALNGGWWLVVWLPWVSNHEVDLETDLGVLTIYYACAFLLTILIECVVNGLTLKKIYPVKKIVTGTLLINVISYIVGSVILYSYSFF